MPRISLSPESKSERSFDYPRLKLEKGERARILCVEKDPVFEYVHTLRAPQIVNGEAVTEMVTAKDGTQVEQTKFDFVGRHVCIGDYGVIDEKGADPDGCPVCRAARESDAVREPERRFAFHVVRYAVKPGGFELASPFTVHVLAWAFAEMTFDKLVDIASEWGSLQEHDLNLGPCTQAQFQKFEISVAAKAAWMESEERKKQVLTTFKENQCKDLSVMIGRRLTRDVIEQDLEKVLHRYRIAFGNARGDRDLADEAGAVAANLEDLLDDDVEKPEPKPEPQESSEEEKPEPEEKVSFDELLNQL